VTISCVAGQQGSISSDDDSNRDPVFSGHSLSLNNVGLDENNQEDQEIEPTLQGPNVCTKQET